MPAASVKNCAWRKLAASYISVFIRTNQFNADAKYTGHAGLALSPASSFSPALTQAAQILLERCFRSGFRYWKAGVMVDGLLQESKVQRDLFSTGHEVQETKLMAALDAVNLKFGRTAVHLASTGINSPWHMKREKLSPRSTTSWQELPRVKA